MSKDGIPHFLKLGGGRHSYDASASPPLSRTPTPLRNVPHKLRPYIHAIMAFRHGQDFQARPSVYQTGIDSEAGTDEAPAEVALTTLFVGISAVFSDTNTAFVAIAIRDTVYLHDFSVQKLELNGSESANDNTVTDHVIDELSSYERKMFCKFIGAGVPYDLMKMAPKLCSRLWAELDTVPISFRPDDERRPGEAENPKYWDVKCVDEQADSMARKCIMYFGPNESPLLQVGYRGLVEVDAGFQSHMCTLDDYQATCGERTWNCMMNFATELKQRGTKIAFFSSTPQGGGVALMRHALVRFARVVGVELSWYCPKPKPGIFRITKNVHNTLQGVTKPHERISPEDKKALADWIKDNANRYWLSEGGPLRDPSHGGADVIVIDDPQMPGLIPLAKSACPSRPVLYRSHIQIRSDLADEEETPQSDIWEFLWQSVQHADIFISHPIPSFVPKNVNRSKVAYMPATTDWLDGLNKPINEWDMAYYAHNYRMQCLSINMTPLTNIKRKYFIQIARFDPSKGIPDLMHAYAEFHHLLHLQAVKPAHDDIPQLLIVGNSSIDDPDGTLIYDSALSLLSDFSSNSKRAHLVPLISVMRLPPSDQLLNTLISNALVVLQLSTREGFEVKVSEALHKGRPVIATKAGGIPLQVQDGKTGWLVDPGDWKAVAQKMLDIYLDGVVWKESKESTRIGKNHVKKHENGNGELWQKMSKAASEGVSDEVGTVGNALCWFYLAAKWSRGRGSSSSKGVTSQAQAASQEREHDAGATNGDGKETAVLPAERWVNDMAREEAGLPYQTGENRLPRTATMRP